MATGYHTQSAPANDRICAATDLCRPLTCILTNGRIYAVLPLLFLYVSPLLAPQVHSLIGDYHTGLQSLYPLNLFDKTHLYTPTISSCHIALFYYASFGYLMLQRYTDAGR